MRKRSYSVLSDGKNLTFTPGKNGSLTYQVAKRVQKMKIGGSGQAKIVSSPSVDFERKKKRQVIADSLTE